MEAGASDAEILPPSLDGAFELPGAKVALPVPVIETGEEDHVEVSEAETIAIRLRDEPQTVGYGANKVELLRRTTDEKEQFKRNKNVIVWTVGALLILLTMLLMLNL